MNDGLFLSVEEAAERLGLNPETIRRRIRRGQLKAQLLPGPRGEQYRIPVSELNTQDAQLVPAAQLPPAVINQINQVMSAVVMPLVEKIEAQNETIEQLRGEICEMRKEAKQQAEVIGSRLDRLHGRSFWQRIFG